MQRKPIDIPDLVVNSCPLGCGECVGIYINDATGHRIVCRCPSCNHGAL